MNVCVCARKQSYSSSVSTGFIVCIRKALGMVAYQSSGTAIKLSVAVAVLPAAVMRSIFAVDVGLTDMFILVVTKQNNFFKETNQIPPLASTTFVNQRILTWI